MSSREELKKKLAIDEHALEIELRDHPELVNQVGEGSVYAASHRDAAKQELEELEALVDRELRLEASKSEDKVTEKQIESNKKIDPRIVRAMGSYLDLKLEAALWSTLSDAFDKRTSALSRLTELYLSNYYSKIEPRGREDMRTIKADQNKKAVAEQRRVRA